MLLCGRGEIEKAKIQPFEYVLQFLHKGAPNRPPEWIDGVMGT